MKTILLIALGLGLLLAIHELWIIIKRSVKALRLKRIRAKNWNSFTGYTSEENQINETKERC